MQCTKIARVFVVFLTAAIPSFLLGQTASKAEITADWNNVLIVSRSTPTLQVVTNPMLRRGSPIHDTSFKALKELGADYVRYVPWQPYPKTAVAELEPPTSSKTSWDFSLIDPMTKDFLAATADHSTVMNFSTIPAWMMTLDSKSIRFDFDKANIKPEYRDILNRIAGILMTLKGYTIAVYGYTDDVGTQTYNL